MFMGFEMNTFMEVLLVPVCVEQGSTNTCILNFQHMGLLLACKFDNCERIRNSYLWKFEHKAFCLLDIMSVRRLDV